MPSGEFLMTSLCRSVKGTAPSCLPGATVLSDQCCWDREQPGCLEKWPPRVCPTGTRRPAHHALETACLRPQPSRNLHAGAKRGRVPAVTTGCPTEDSPKAPGHGSDEPLFMNQIVGNKGDAFLYALVQTCEELPQTTARQPWDH